MDRRKDKGGHSIAGRKTTKEINLLQAQKTKLMSQEKKIESRE